MNTQTKEFYAPGKMLMAVVVFFLMIAAYNLASAGSVKNPDRFTRDTCVEHVKMNATQIATARWKAGWTEEQLLSVPFDDEAPNWVRQIVHNWIKSAYKWEGSPQAWLQSLLNDCQSVTES